MSSFVLFLHLFRINDLIKKNLSLSISEESGWVSIMAAGSCLFNLVKGRVGITIGSDLDDTSEVAAFFPGLAYLFSAQAVVNAHIRFFASVLQIPHLSMLTSALHAIFRPVQ